METETKEYYVYKWCGYYILAHSIEQAQRIWETWADRERILASESGDYGKLKIITKETDQELFPKRLKKLKAEAPCPCIVESVDWDKPLYCYQRED